MISKAESVEAVDKTRVTSQEINMETTTVANEVLGASENALPPDKALKLTSSNIQESGANINKDAAPKEVENGSFLITSQKMEENTLFLIQTLFSCLEEKVTP